MRAFSSVPKCLLPKQAWLLRLVADCCHENGAGARLSPHPRMIISNWVALEPTWPAVTHYRLQKCGLSLLRKLENPSLTGNSTASRRTQEGWLKPQAWHTLNAKKVFTFITSKITTGRAGAVRPWRCLLTRQIPLWRNPCKCFHHEQNCLSWLFSHPNVCINLKGPRHI